jgi:hypothetical protein
MVSQSADGALIGGLRGMAEPLQFERLEAES